MVAQRHDCDEGRLRRHLAGTLGDCEQGELASHLDGCEACREALDELATDGSWWGSFREYLGGESVGTGRTQHFPRWAGAEAPLGPGGDDEDRDLSILKLLGPPEDSRHLGKLGSYDVLEVIGRGGMGIVLKAIDPGLGRTVAIKVLGPELAFLSSARKRFAREGKAAASVAHEHVVAIHGVDTWKGIPYLVMQYIPGISLQQRIDREGPLSVVEVLRIGMQVAAGLAAAHAQGLVHRDIKPANILLENGVERVKITDFGLARAADAASLSQSGVVSGTPQYMAPEQARCEAVDPRADLFSLGSVLYAMCTGHSPFRGETTMAVLRRVCEDAPRPIRRQNPEVPAWLADIISKLLAKRPDERFQSAAEVAALLGRCVAYLELADDGPPPFPADGGRSVRAGRRRWTMVGAGVVLSLAALGAVGNGGVAAIAELAATVFRIRTPEGILVVSVEDPEVKLRVDGQDLVVTGAGPSEFRYRPGPHKVVATRGDTSLLDETLTVHRGGKRVLRITREGVELDGQGPAAADRTDWPGPRAAAPVSTGDPRGSIAGWPERRHSNEDLADLLRPVPLGTTRGISPWPFGIVSSGCYSPDGRLLALGCGDGSVVLHDATERRIRAILGADHGRVWSLAFSPDGGTLAAASGDWNPRSRNGRVRLWDVASGTLRATLADDGSLPLAVAYSPDGRTLAWAGRDRTIALWDTEGHRIRAVCRGHQWTVRALVFHPRDPVLVSAGFDGSIRFWDARTGEPAGETIRHEGRSSNRVAFSPDGKLFAANSGPRSDEPGIDRPVPGWITIWDWETRKEVRRIEGFRFDILGIAFSPDGRTLASAGGFYTTGAEVGLWDVATGRRIRSLAGHRYWAESALFSPDGKTLVSLGGAEPDSGEVRVWDLASPPTPGS